MVDETGGTGGMPPEPVPAQPPAPQGTPDPRPPDASPYHDAPKHEKSRVNPWMIVSIVAIVLALIAGYLAFTYKGQVEDWEAAANETLEQLEAAGLELEDAIASSVADYEQQIDDLTAQLRQSQTESGISAGNLAQAREDLAATEAELESTQQDLTETQSQLEETQSQLDEVQTELDDANTRLEQLGELVLPNGTYVGAVLAARTGPIPAIIFQEGTAWRVAEVADDVRITSGGRELTLEEFATLLQSSDPADVALVNGNYQVKVNGGLVTSIRKSQA